MGQPGMGMLKELNLTEDQKAKLKVLHEGFAAQDSVSKVQMMKQREAIRAERHQALAKILTPEQLSQLDKLQVERGHKMGQMGQMGQGRGQQMNKRAQMLQGRGMQNGRMQQMNGRPAFNKKNAKAFLRHAKRMHKAPLVNPEIRIKNQVERMTKQLDLTPEQAAKIQAIQEKHFKSDIAKYKKFEKKRDAQFKKRHGNLEEIKAVLTPEQVQKLDALKEKAPGMQGPHGPMNGPAAGRN